MIAIEIAADDACLALCGRTGFDGNTALLMHDRDDVLGEALYRLSGECVDIGYLHAPDAALTDVLLRAVLNASAAHGARTALLTADEIVLFARAKGYCAPEGEPRLQIADFFAKSACKG